MGPHAPPGALIQHMTAPELWPRWFEAAHIAPPALTSGPRHELMSMALNAALLGLGIALLPACMTGDAVARRRRQTERSGLPGMAARTVGHAGPVTRPRMGRRASAVRSRALGVVDVEHAGGYFVQ